MFPNPFATCILLILSQPPPYATPSLSAIENINCAECSEVVSVLSNPPYQIAQCESSVYYESSI